MSDFIVEYPNALSGDMCDRIIAKFEANPHLTYSGQTGTYVQEVEESNQTKISTDLFITGNPDFAEEDAALYESLSENLSNYHNFMSEFSITHMTASGIIDKGFQVQRTSPGGRYSWHTDEFVGAIPKTVAEVDGLHLCATERRMYTYIFYLNDKDKDFSGGYTEFIVGKGTVKQVKPEKGKLLMFPANALCTHQGRPVTEGLKYLATGWICDIIFSSMGDDDAISDETLALFEEHKNRVLESRKR